MDEHFVLGPADTLRRDVRAAAMGSKFFMYSPMMMYLINVVRGIYEALIQPLDLDVPSHQVTYMVLSRAIAAAFGTATILVTYAIAARVAGRVAGLLAAFFLACAVLHLRDSHFATTDMPMVFFCMLTVWLSLRVAERGDWISLVGAGAAVGAAVASKYTGLPLAWGGGRRVPSVTRTAVSIEADSSVGDWVAWGMVPILAAIADLPLARSARRLVSGQVPPRLQTTGDRAAHGRHPADHLRALRRRVQSQALLASQSLVESRAGARGARHSGCLLVAGQMGQAGGGRRVVPGDLLPGRGANRRSDDPLQPSAHSSAGHRGRCPERGLACSTARTALAMLVVGVTVATTGLYALAYMNVFRQEDARVEASKWLVENVPQGSRILVEPSQNTPPMGSIFHRHQVPA